jgi:hypothetical protein
MRQNRNSNKKSLSKNLKYMKTFESFEGDYQLMLEEESWLSKTLASIALMLPFLGPTTPTKAMQVSGKDPIEVKTQTGTKKDTAKTFVKTATAGKKFDLEIVGFKPENVIVKEIQMDRDLFTKETVVVGFTTDKLTDDGKLQDGVQPSIITGGAKVTIVNSHADENMKLVITISVEQTDRLDEDGNVVSAKTEWTLNGKPLSEYRVSPGNDKNTVTLEE